MFLCRLVPLLLMPLAAQAVQVPCADRLRANGQRFDQLDAAYIRNYTAVAHRHINYMLRHQPRAPLDYQGEGLLRAMLKLPPYRGLVHRGTDWERAMIDGLAVGAVYDDPAFLSASKREDVGERFRRNVQFRMMSCSGREIDAYTASPDPEDEVLFLPHTRFRVTGKSVVTPVPGFPYSYTLFEMEEMACDDF